MLLRLCCPLVEPLGNAGCSAKRFPHCSLCLFPLSQRAYKPFFLECTAEYRVEKMPYLITPKSKPIGSKKVTDLTYFYVWRRARPDGVTPPGLLDFSYCVR